MITANHGQLGAIKIRLTPRQHQVAEWATVIFRYVTHVLSDGDVWFVSGVGLNVHHEDREKLFSSFNSWCKVKEPE